MTLKETHFLHLHKQLRKYKFFYYELDKSLISDYEFDMMEKEYEELADNLKINRQYRVSNFVGFSYRIPMNPFNF